MQGKKSILEDYLKDDGFKYEVLSVIAENLTPPFTKAKLTNELKRSYKENQKFEEYSNYIDILSEFGSYLLNKVITENSESRETINAKLDILIEELKNNVKSEEEKKNVIHEKLTRAKEILTDSTFLKSIDSKYELTDFSLYYYHIILSHLMKNLPF